MQPDALAPYPTKPLRANCTGCSGSPDVHDPAAAPDDWHTLLLAVRTRLRDVLEAWPVLADTLEQREAAARSRALAFDCAEALDQLHDALLEHGRRYRRLAFDLEQARAELARYAARP